MKSNSCNVLNQLIIWDKNLVLDMIFFFFFLNVEDRQTVCLSVFDCVLEYIGMYILKICLLIQLCI